MVEHVGKLPYFWRCIKIKTSVHIYIYTYELANLVDSKNSDVLFSFNKLVSVKSFVAL